MEPVPPHTRRSLTHIDCYMDDVISAVHVRTERRHQVFDRILCALKWLFPSIPGEAKDSVSFKKLLKVEGDWSCINDFLRWIIDTEAGTVALPERNIQEL